MLNHIDPGCCYSILYRYSRMLVHILSSRVYPWAAAIPFTECIILCRDVTSSPDLCTLYRWLRHHHGHFHFRGSVQCTGSVEGVKRTNEDAKLLWIEVAHPASLWAAAIYSSRSTDSASQGELKGRWRMRTRARMDKITTWLGIKRFDDGSLARLQNRAVTV